jgi:hypothetical protein
MWQSQKRQHAGTERLRFCITLLQHQGFEKLRRRMLPDSAQPERKGEFIFRVGLWHFKIY